MAAHHVHTARDENRLLPNEARHSAANVSSISQRSPLADVSPNAKARVPYANLKSNKPMAGSPLKRSFTAMTEGGGGLKYLKRRRLSAEETLSEQVDGSADRERQSMGRGSEMDAAAAGRFRPSMSQAEGPYYHQPITKAPSPSPTEPNTPPSDHSNQNSQGSSGDRASFSSLINYDPSSQAHFASQQPQPQPQQASGLVFKRLSHAETLMLRLRVAMYKVRTNQIDVPLEELRLEGEDRPWSAPSAEEVVAARRRETYLDEQGPVEPAPRLLPAPSLRPTAYSSRFVYDERMVPSSPPVMAGHDRTITHGGSDATPRTVRRNEWERSSPPEEDEASRAVKGSVAEGLLGLRNSS